MRSSRCIAVIVLLFAFLGASPRPSLAETRGEKLAAAGPQEAASGPSVIAESGWWRHKRGRAAASASAEFDFDDGGTVEIRIEPEGSGGFTLAARAWPEGTEVGLSVRALIDGPGAARRYCIERWLDDRRLGLALVNEQGEGNDRWTVVPPASAACEVGRPFAVDGRRSEWSAAGIGQGLAASVLGPRLAALHAYLAGPRGETEADVVGLVWVGAQGPLPVTARLQGSGWASYRACLDGGRRSCARKDTTAAAARRVAADSRRSGHGGAEDLGVEPNCLAMTSAVCAGLVGPEIERALDSFPGSVPPSP